MRMNLKHEENQICLALFHGTGENVQLGPSEHWARHCPQNGLYGRYWFTHSCKNQEKTVLSGFFLRTCKFGFRSHLYLDHKFFCCQFSLKKKYSFTYFYDFCIFKKYHRHEYKAKVSSSPGPLIYPVRQGPCGLNPALFGEIPLSVEFPPHRPLLFPAVKTTTCHFSTVNLVSYT